MKIDRIEIENFRCFESLVFSPKPGLNVLVGENSAGKSSLMTAVLKTLRATSMDSTNPLPHFDVDDLRYGELGNGLRVTCHFELESTQQHELLLRLLQHRLTSEQSKGIHERIGTIFSHLSVTFDWKGGQQESSIKLGPLVVFAGTVSNSIRQNVSRKNLADLFNERTASVAALTEAVNQESVFISGSIERLLGEILLTRFRAFDEFRARPMTESRASAMESFQGSQTPSVLLNLKNHRDLKQRQRYQKIRQEFAHFFPSLSIEAVETGPGSGSAEIQFYEANRPYQVRLSNVGAGVAELLTLLTNLVARENDVLVVEEPELHLHVHSRRRLQNLIKATSESNQMFVITHDPYFVDPDALGGLVRVYATNRGSQIASVQSTLSSKISGQLKTAMKDSTKREMVFAKAVMLVEDESQREFLRGRASKLDQKLDTYGVSIISVDGHDGFEPYVTLANALKLPFICLRDKSWGSSPDKPQHTFRSLGCELEEYLVKEGLESLMSEARQEVGLGKPRVAQFVGDRIVTNRIPKFISQLIEDGIQLGKLQTAGETT